MRSNAGLAAGSSRRAQSSVIGVVMVISITLLGVTGVLLFGTSALLDAQGQSELDAAEHAMTQLDSRFSLSALGSSERQSAVVDLDGDATLRVEGDRGWMNVSVVNRSSREVEDTVLNTTLGAVSYEQDGTSIAYQGGGVWKRTPDGRSVMVSPPEFHYRTRKGGDPTLTLPLVTVRGADTIAGEASVEKDETIAMFPQPGNADRSNPLRGGEINVTVQSEYYRAWGAFFEERTGGNVHYDHDRERVMITLVVGEGAESVSGGIVSGAPGYELRFRNQAEVDSYNSTDGGGYSSGSNSSVIAAGSVLMEQKATVEGDLTVGGSIEMDKDTEVTGNLSYGGSRNIDSRADVGGWIRNDADVESPSPVDWLIDSKRGDYSSDSDNDNDESGADIDTSTNTLENCGGPCTLPAGNYYLDEIDLGNGEKLLLDTNGGDVEVVVDGDVDIQSAEVEVIGDGTARLYVEGNLYPKQSNVWVPDHRSPRLWFYMNPGAEVDEFKQVEFVGVIYGPGGGANEGVEIDLQTSNHVYGGLVGYIPGGVTQSTSIHFDEALASEDPLGGHGDDTPSVTYMHVTVNRVNVTPR